MGLKRAAASDLLDCWLKDLADAAVALHSAEPRSTNEFATYAGYARQPLAGRIAVVRAAAGQIVANTAAVDFGPAAQLWPAATHIAIWSARAGGEILLTGTVTGYTLPRAAGERLHFPVHAIRLTIATDD